MIQEINIRQVRKALVPSVWDIGNRALYDLCKIYPQHVNNEEILAKVWLIGRAYTAAIERRPNADSSGDDFYTDIVIPRIKESKIDAWLCEILHYNKPTEKNYSHIIAVHARVTDLFKQISGINKRSLASKYIHFHLPNLFFIYDSRAAKSVNKFIAKSVKIPKELKEYDGDYAKFYMKCMCIVDTIDKKYKIAFSPRQLDNFLLNAVQ